MYGPVRLAVELVGTSDPVAHRIDRQFRRRWPDSKRRDSLSDSVMGLGSIHIGNDPKRAARWNLQGYLKLKWLHGSAEGPARGGSPSLGPSWWWSTRTSWAPQDPPSPKDPREGPLTFKTID